MRRNVGAMSFVHALTRRSSGFQVFGVWSIQRVTGVSGRCCFSSDARRTGVVRRWNDDRGFGFIKPDEEDKELFVHRSSVRQGMQLSSGQAVSFEVKWNEQKQQNHAISIHDPTPREDEGMWPSVDDGALDTEKCDPARSAQVREELELKTGSSRRVAVQTKPKNDAPQESEVELKMKKLEEQLTSVSQSQQAWSSFQQLEHVPIEPLRIPEDVSTEQRLDLLTGHVEQLRVQGQQMQQLLLQGMFAMVKQQAAQSANLERAVLALAENLGANGSQTAAAAAVIAPTTEHHAAPSLSETRRSAVQNLTRDSKDETPDQPREEKPNEKVIVTNNSQSHADTQAEDLAEPAATPTEEVTKPTASNPKTVAASKNESTPQVAQEKDSMPEKEKLRESQAAKEVESAFVVSSEPLNAAAEKNEPSREETQQGVVEGSSAKAKETTTEVVNFPIHHLVGSFNDWTIHSNHEQTCGTWVTVRPSAPKIGRGLHREEFQILADGSWDKRLFPSGGTNETVVALTPGKTCKAAECTPKASGHGRNWAIDGKPGSTFRVTLDPETLIISCELK